MVNKITTPPTTSELIGTVNEIIDDKQDTLVSGTNIKTINNTPILGSGNIDIQSGGNYTAGTGIDITNDIISVTNAISTGAALGATALQPSALNGYATQAWVGQQGYITGITSSDVTTALGYTPYNSSNPNGYITNSALAPYALSSSLATVATSGSYNDLSNKPTIPTVNNATLTITQGGVSKGTFTANASSDVTIALDSGGSSLTAGTGIDITNNVISVEGVKDQRNTSTAIKTWTGNRAQYDAIATKDNNTLYNITDDSDTTLPLLEALYPVGSVYITTASTCPLSTLISGSTWVEETSRILVDKYVSGTDWWELYSDGWCRQGGVIQMPGSGVTKTLLKSYKDTNYNVLLTCGSNTTGWPIAWTNNPSKTNSSFYMDGTGNSGGAERTIQVNWEACGYTSTTTTYKRFRRTL